MHEISIARAIFDLMVEHAPSQAVVRYVTVRAGPLRAIEPEAMRWAWRAVTDHTSWSNVKLELELSPWQLTCPQCGRCWVSQELQGSCTCGCNQPSPVLDDQLSLVSLEVDEVAETKPDEVCA